MTGELKKVLTYKNNKALRNQAFQYHQYGYSLIPLKDKIPQQQNWQKQVWKPDFDDKSFKECSSLGFVIPKNVVVIDVDNHNNKIGDASLEAMSKYYDFDFKKNCQFVVNTASGGLHLYYEIPDSNSNFKIVNTLKNFPQVEFKSVGRQVVIPESILSGGRKYKTHILYSNLGAITDLPDNIFGDISKKQEASPTKIASKLNYENNPTDIRQFELYLQSQGIITEGERNNRIYTIVCEAKNLGISPIIVEKMIVDWQQENVFPPIGKFELRQIINSAQRNSKDGVGTKSISEMSWEDPILFDNYEVPEIPCDLLPNSLSKFASELADYTETPAGLSVMTVISVLSIALQKKFIVKPREKDSYKETVNIYAISTLISGNRKSAVFNSCTKPISDWEDTQRDFLAPAIKEQKSRYESEKRLIESMRKKLDSSDGNKEAIIQEIICKEQELKKPDSLPSLFTNDITSESLISLMSEQNEKMAIISDEGGIVEVMSGLYSGGNANIDIFLKSWDGGKIRQKRKDRNIELKNPLLTMNLVVQPAVIQSMSSKKPLDGRGLLERFLYCTPKSKMGFRSNDKEPVSTESASKYDRKIKELLSIKDVDSPNILTLTSESYQEWKRFQNNIEIDLREGGRLEVCRSWGGKICGYALRIAALFHVCEYGENSLKIEKATMEKSIKLCSLLTCHAIAAFSSIEINPDYRDSKEILNWIKDNDLDNFAKSDITKKMQNRVNFRSKRIDDLLSILTERNIISHPIREGKKTLRFKVNPAVKN